MPATLVKASTKKGRPRPLIEGSSILDMCISQFGDKEQQLTQLSDLNKLKNFFRFISYKERQIGAGDIPLRKQKLVQMIDETKKSRKKPQLKPNTDSLLMSSRSSDIPASDDGVIVSQKNHERDQAIHAKLLKQ